MKRREKRMGREQRAGREMTNEDGREGKGWKGNGRDEKKREERG